MKLWVPAKGSRGGDISPCADSCAMYVYKAGILGQALLSDSGGLYFSDYTGPLARSISTSLSNFRARRVPKTWGPSCCWWEDAFGGCPAVQCTTLQWFCFCFSSSGRFPAMKKSRVISPASLQVNQVLSKVMFESFFKDFIQGVPWVAQWFGAGLRPRA